MALISFQSFKVIFNQDIPVKKKLLKQKEGSLLVYNNIKVEIPHLPGYFPQDLKSAHEELSDLDWAQLQKENFPHQMVENILQKLGPSSWVAFWSLLQRQKKSWDFSLFCPGHTFIPHLKGDLPLLENLPNPSVKIKIARSEIKKEIDHLCALIKKNPDIRLRLDANQNLSLDELMLYWHKLKTHLDYFESPLKKQSDYQKIEKEIPLALDELAYDQVLGDQPLGPLKIKAIILRPALDQIHKTFSLAQKAQKLGLQVITSAAYEGPLGLMALEQFHRQFYPHLEVTSGLSTWPLIKNQNELIKTLG